MNKYYLLDLQPKSSLIRWLVEQGHTLFVISWVNPGPDLADKGLADYLELGPVAALGAIAKATGEREIDLFGFCMGGTLAAIATALLTARGEGKRIASLTTIGSMFDFANMGQWATFTEPSQVEAMERHLEAQGVLAAHELQGLFSAGSRQRSDLVLGGQPLSARQGSAALRHPPLVRRRRPYPPAPSCSTGPIRILRDNALTQKGALSIGADAIDLGGIDTPAMIISLKDDHVSAWQATYDGAKLLGGDTQFLLGGSGHNAGVINPPAANKHGYWTNERMPATAEAWMETATRHEGSLVAGVAAMAGARWRRPGEGAQAEEGDRAGAGRLCADAVTPTSSSWRRSGSTEHGANQFSQSAFMDPDQVRDDERENDEGRKHDLRNDPGRAAGRGDA